jgi:hypothetical protein
VGGFGRLPTGLFRVVILVPLISCIQLKLFRLALFDILGRKPGGVGRHSLDKETLVFSFASPLLLDWL